MHCKRNSAARCVFHPRLPCVVLFWACAQAFSFAGSASAADPSAEMAQALRDRGWYDTAAEYVDWVEQSPLATPEFRRQAPYHRAASVAAQARETSNLRTRAELLDRAVVDYLQLGDSDDVRLSISALREAANLSAERAITMRTQALRLPATAADRRESLLAKARESLTLAKQSAVQLEETCDRQIARMPKPAMLHAEPGARELLSLLRSRAAEAGFLAPLADFELAQTYPRDSQSWTQSLQAAQDGFALMRRRYEGSLVGVTSQLYLGRCQQLRGEHEQAIKSYERIVGKPVADPQFRRWTAKAHRHRAECLLALGQTGRAIRDIEQWLESSQPAERQQAEWLAAAFRLAEAYLANVDQDSQSSAEDKRQMSQARLLLRDVASQRGEFQQQAKISLASFRQPAGDSQDYETFAEAFAAGKSALEVANSSKLAARLARENNPEAVDELQRRSVASREEALELLQLALRLANEDSPKADVQSARYFLCFLYWELGRLQDAAQLGERIVRESADSQYARPAAKVALNAYDQLYRQARSDGSAQQQRDQLRRFAELISTRWPDSDEAGAAVSLLISLALEENNIEAAEQMLGRLPSAARGAGQLSLGAALWTTYLKSVSGDASTADEQAKRRAGELLAAGFQEVRSAGEPTDAIATGVLYYAQLLLQKGETQQAIDVLEDPQVGPLTLGRQGQFSDRPELLIETYKAGLRAYLGMSPPPQEKVQQLISSLEQASTAAGDTQEDLTGVYVSLGLQLEQQIRELNAAGRGDQAAALAGAFENIVAQVAQRAGANDWRVANWVGRTYLQLGQLLEGEQTDEMIARAERQFREILAEAERDPSFAPNPSALLGVSKQLADCSLALGKYKQGLQQYLRILREKPNLLELQIAVAQGLQDWGVAEENVKTLEQAIGGAVAQSDGKNLVWGWIRLSKVVEAARRRAAAKANDAEAQQQAQQYEEIFYRARYNAALARFRSAQYASGVERETYLQTVQQSLNSMRTLYPELGGPRWKPRFDQLSQQVNTQLQSGG